LAEKAIAKLFAGRSGMKEGGEVALKEWIRTRVGWIWQLMSVQEEDMFRVHCYYRYIHEIVTDDSCLSMDRFADQLRSFPPRNSRAARKEALQKFKLDES
jgi:hypothetical protein